MITEGVLQRREPLRGATCRFPGGRGDSFEGVAGLLGEFADLVQILIRRVVREAPHLSAEAFPWLADQSGGDLVDLRLAGLSYGGGRGACTPSTSRSSNVEYRVEFMASSSVVRSAARWSSIWRIKLVAHAW